MMNNRPRPRHRTAFSLLEVVLAVALSGIVIYLIAGAIEFHLRQLTLRRSRIEEARIARAILTQIADDLQAVVLDRPIDLSSLQQLMDSTTGSGGNSAAGPNTSDDDPLSADTSGTDATNAATSTSTLLPTTPGIYGNAYELQVDVGRIPRYEEYAIADQLNDLETLRMLSDVKTVAYFLVGQPGMPGSITGQGFSFGSAGGLNTQLEEYRMLGLPQDEPRQGLGRRSLDRATTRYAIENAGLSYLDQQTELFAPEVAYIQFRYFDGLQWLMEWDTEMFGGIPVAIEIVIVLRPPSDVEQSSTLGRQPANSLDQDLWQFNPDYTYRLVVHLPGAEPIDTSSALGQETAAESEGGTG